MFIVDVKELRDKIILKDNNWKNKEGSNCYAYALGLDINKRCIHKDAYQPGTIYAHYNYIPLYQIRKLDLNKRIILDLKTLKLDYEATTKPNNMEIAYFENYRCVSWDVLLFIRELGMHDFHFARVNDRGELWHKHGYHNVPNTTTIEELEKDCYVFTKRYRVSKIDYIKK